VRRGEIETQWIEASHRLLENQGSDVSQAPHGYQESNTSQATSENQYIRVIQYIDANHAAFDDQIIYENQQRLVSHGEIETQWTEASHRLIEYHVYMRATGHMKTKCEVRTMGDMKTIMIV